MVDLVCCLTSFLFFDIPLLQYYINAKIISNFLFTLWRYISSSFAAFSGLFCYEFFETLRLFETPILYYSNLRSSIVSCLSSRDIYLFIGISLSCSFVTFSELFSSEFFGNFVPLLAIPLPIQSSVALPFSNYSFWNSFIHICCRLFSMIKKFLVIFTNRVFSYIFTNVFTHIFSKRQKSTVSYKYLISWLNWISSNVYFIFYL